MLDGEGLVSWDTVVVLPFVPTCSSGCFDLILHLMVRSIQKAIRNFVPNNFVLFLNQN